MSELSLVRKGGGGAKVYWVNVGDQHGILTLPAGITWGDIKRLSVTASNSVTYGGFGIAFNNPGNLYLTFISSVYNIQSILYPASTTSFDFTAIFGNSFGFMFALFTV